MMHLTCASPMENLYSAVSAVVWSRISTTTRIPASLSDSPLSSSSVASKASRVMASRCWIRIRTIAQTPSSSSCGKHRPSNSLCPSDLYQLATQTHTHIARTNARTHARTHTRTQTQMHLFDVVNAVTHWL